jgi:hypothetical protein
VVFSKHDHATQALLFDRPDEALRECVQVRTSRRQLDRRHGAALQDLPERPGDFPRREKAWFQGLLELRLINSTLRRSRLDQSSLQRSQFANNSGSRATTTALEVQMKNPSQSRNTNAAGSAR